MGFLGEYSAKIDPKGRFLLPSDIKKQITGSEQSKFILNKGLDKCLDLYTQENWQPIYNTLAQLNDFNPEERAFKRMSMSGARNIELDVAGRILIPKHLIDYAGLDKEIVMIGSADKVEIWDKVSYERLFDAYTPEKYSEIAQKILGNIPKKT